MNEPTTLIEAINHFSNVDTCVEYVAKLRWSNGVACPTCGSTDVRYIKTRHIWECKAQHPKRQFSVKVGTIFEDSAINLTKWLAAIWMIANAKNGVSSYEIARGLGVTQKTAWFMMHRIRLAMGTDNGKFSGSVEVDETFIGGKSANMHKSKREKVIQGRGAIGKVAVMGLLERHTRKVKTHIIADTSGNTIPPVVRNSVEVGSNLITDAFPTYSELDKEYVHEVIDHAEAYVRGHVHTNGIENFWSLLKRTIKGTYICIESCHLSRYLDEQAFRFNTRNDVDAGRFQDVIAGIIDKRLTYNELIGLNTTPA